MNARASHGRITSALGEHLVAVLVVAILVIGALAALPALRAQTEGTATRAQDRVNLPLVVASDLESTP